MSDVDDDGVVLNVDGGRMQELDYVKVHITEQCLWMIVARTHKGRMDNDEREVQGLYKVCTRTDV
jgi:hypothetical protein